MVREHFGIASFRSRQQVMRFEAALRRAGLRVEIITTPRDVSIGCGLSVRFETEDYSRVCALYRQLRPNNLIGFYLVEPTSGGRPKVTPLE